MIKISKIEGRERNSFYAASAVLGCCARWLSSAVERAVGIRDNVTCPIGTRAATNGGAAMTGGETGMIRFQCPRCGHELEQTIGNLRLSKSMRCRGYDVGINIDTDRLANAAEEIKT